MERLTAKCLKGSGYYMACSKTCPYDCMENCDCEEFDNFVNRLGAIEDILGDEYDLDRLRVIMNQRMTMREEVYERFHLTKNIPVDRLRELAQADREGLVRIIAGPNPREAVCGNCGNFIRNPGTRTGVCRVQSFYRDQHGKEEPRRGIFSPSQSRKACRKFVRAEAALRREQDG